MSDSLLQRIPVVAGLAYIERVRRLPAAFTAALQPEPENRYMPFAIAVRVEGQKVGYVAPEIARGHVDRLANRQGNGPLTCPGRHGTRSDHETSGVELLLDFSTIGNG